MNVCLFQSVVSPYRVPLFRRLAEVDGVNFRLLLLSKRFKVRPQWKTDVGKLPFRVHVPFGISVRTGEEKEFCINPFLVATLVRLSPDVVICGGYNIATMMTWLYAKATGRPYVIWTEATEHTDGRISGLRLAMRRRLARDAAAFIDAGTQAREYVRWLRPGVEDASLFRAFNCVENERFSEAPRTVPDGASTSRAGGEARRMLFVGKLNERKGIPQLLDAYLRVVQKSRGAPRLVLLGEGPCRQDIEGFRARHGLEGLEVMGWVDNQAAARYYASSDVFVLLSKVDHNPLVLFEALAAGLPVVCSKGVCNAVDFVADGVNGFVVDPDNTAEVASRLQEVLEWAEDRRLASRQYSAKSVARANYASAAEGFLAACRYAVSRQ